MRIHCASIVAFQRPPPPAHLHAQADGAVPLVGSLGGVHWVVVHVDDLVQVARHRARHLVQLLKVKEPAQVRAAKPTVRWVAVCHAAYPATGTCAREQADRELGREFNWGQDCCQPKPSRYPIRQWPSKNAWCPSPMSLPPVASVQGADQLAPLSAGGVVLTHKPRQRDGRQVAHGSLVGRGILHNLCMGRHELMRVRMTGAVR